MEIKVGKRKITYGCSDDIERAVKMEIPGVFLLYSRDYRRDIGNLYVHFEDGYWLIWYQYRFLSYSLAEAMGDIDICLDITDESQKIIKWEKDEKTGEYSIKEKADWLIKDWEGCGFKVITHSINEAENAEELLEPKSSKFIFRPKVKLEYYDKNKILKIPFFKDEIRINIENENLEYIRENKKIIKAYPLNKEIHFYGIEPVIKEVHLF